VDEGLNVAEKNITRCGFVLTGSCSDSKAHTIEGNEYREVISVYLKPQKETEAMIKKFK